MGKETRKQVEREGKGREDIEKFADRRIEGGLTTTYTYFQKPKIDRNVCVPYDDCVYWNYETGMDTVVLSKRPFEDAQSFAADFHSPILHFECGSITFSVPDAFESRDSHNIYINREKINLARDLFGKDFNGEVDARGEKEGKKLQVLLENSVLRHQPRLMATRFIQNLHNNEDAFTGDPICRHKTGLLEKYTKTTLGVNEVAYFCPDLVGNKMGIMGGPQMYKKIIGAGYVIVSREDYVELGKPKQLFVKSEFLGDREMKKAYAKIEVHKRVRSLKKKSSEADYNELYKKVMMDHLCSYKPEYVRGV